MKGGLKVDCHGKMGVTHRAGDIADVLEKYLAGWLNIKRGKLKGSGRYKGLGYQWLGWKDGIN
jgi:hypothetical protein